MSVSMSEQAMLVPIFRKPEEYAFNRSIIGRWHARPSVAGDASGGTYSVSAVLTTQGNAIVGQYTLFDVQLFTWNSNANLLNPYAQFRIYSYELSSGGFTIQPRWDMALALSGHLMTNCFPPPFKYRMSMGDGSAAFVNLLVGPNTNAVAIEAHFGGYLYDERMI